MSGDGLKIKNAWSMQQGSANWNKLDVWNHLIYMCGRYTRSVKIGSSFLSNTDFIHGLKKNKNLEHVRASQLQDFETDKDAFWFIGSLPMKKLSGDLTVYEGLNKAGCQLKLDVLTITSYADPTKALCSKNFSASEIQLFYLPIGVFIEAMEKVHRDNKLNPNLEKVKKWMISTRDYGLPEPLLQILIMLKSISPDMEQYTMELDWPPTLNMTRLDELCTKIENLIPTIKKQWIHTPDFRLHINIKVEIPVDSELYHNFQDVKEYVRDFFNSEIEDLPMESNKIRFTTSKRIIFTEKFILDLQILIGCYPPLPPLLSSYLLCWD
ncbi:hypothetical protein FO519_007579 [Halicephalobus sp. NKZ332]|nr:hypothetical protein FO519_007579 [Halicephalobus sp. NKZ332]